MNNKDDEKKFISLNELKKEMHEGESELAFNEFMGVLKAHRDSLNNDDFEIDVEKAKLLEELNEVFEYFVNEVVGSGEVRVIRMEPKDRDCYILFNVPEIDIEGESFQIFKDKILNKINNIEIGAGFKDDTITVATTVQDLYVPKKK